MKKILALIPARGGSKGIPRKNIKSLAGKPMIAYVIDAVKRAGNVDRVLVTTDDADIAAVAKQCGAEVPFLRPAELAGDAVATLPVLQHALAELKKTEGYTPDYVLLVYPTSPLLSSARIEEAIALALEHDADSVISGTYDTGHYWAEEEGTYRRLYPLELKNRQWTKPLFKENGAIYLSKPTVLEKQLVANTAIPLIMDVDENVDVDDLSDFQKVERILLKKKTA